MVPGPSSFPLGLQNDRIVRESTEGGLMKLLRWLIILLLLLLLLFLLYSCFGKKTKQEVEIELGPVGYSVWPDGSLAVAFPVMNEGKGAADRWADVWEKVTGVCT